MSAKIQLFSYLKYSGHKNKKLSGQGYNPNYGLSYLSYRILSHPGIKEEPECSCRATHSIYMAESVIKVRIPVIYLQRAQANIPKFATS